MFRSLKPYQLVVDVIVAALFLLLVAPYEVAATPGDVWDALGGAAAAATGIAIAVLFAAAVAVRRLSPALALGLAWAAALLQVALSHPPTASDIAIFGVLYATAAYGGRVVYWAGLASAALGALVIAVYLTAGPHGAGEWSLQNLTVALLTLVASAFALGLAWTTGALVRTGIRARENRRAQIRAEAEAVAVEERVRIARDMHDVVAHSLAVVIAQADGARYAAATDPDAAPAALATISTTARAALADVRLLLTQLRHSPSDGPQPTLADLDALYAQVRAAGVALEIHVDPAPPGEPPAAVQLAVYRILQEALTNALRHGDGGVVAVRLAWHPDRVDLSVRNALPEAGAHPSRTAGSDAPASQFATAEQPGGAAHGLIGMRERAQLVGGRLDAGAEGGDFVVRATIPVGGPR